MKVISNNFLLDKQRINFYNDLGLSDGVEAGYFNLDDEVAGSSPAVAFGLCSSIGRARKYPASIFPPIYIFDGGEVLSYFIGEKHLIRLFPIMFLG